ncbi:hypothetical protein [Deinococcus aquiradiocola]|uniref:Uncharacterized protein n=1 Tax=Deinococcus aquiradiocola TaxID=393059 RepID=A0A917P7Q6_9DEIO|nr:hypothetical protein [Deinococcus aquiradiocola]GGJ65568.1 hypothetical protein GCM10008939_06910 [Deinococcus aquiradiocola]
MNERLISAAGFTCAGHLKTGEFLEGILILSYNRQTIPGFPHPVGTGMERRCIFTVGGPALTSLPGQLDATVTCELLGERLQIIITPEVITPAPGSWRLQGPYEPRNRWKLPTVRQAGERDALHGQDDHPVALRQAAPDEPLIGRAHTSEDDARRVHDLLAWGVNFERSLGDRGD